MQDPKLALEVHSGIFAYTDGARRSYASSPSRYVDGGVIQHRVTQEIEPAAGRALVGRCVSGDRKGP